MFYLRQGFALRFSLLWVVHLFVWPQLRCQAAEPAAFESFPLRVPGNGPPGFTLMPPAQTGITFTNLVLSARSIHTLVASGVAAGDVDGDGLCDLYFCSQDGPNVLYRNLGNWKFEDITASAGVACPGQHSIGATFVDVNGDGTLDLIVTARGGPNRLFINDGKGHFTEDLTFPGRESKLASTSIAVADIDGDGALDIYICNYTSHSYLDEHIEIGPELSREWQRVREGKELSPKFKGQFYVQGGSLSEKGEPDELLLNDGHGHFKRADISRFTMPPGSPPPGPLDGSGLAAQFRDFNGDGAPDLYVCNDFQTPDRLWLNDGHGYFTLATPEVFRHMSSSSMTVDVADVNLDGHMDFFVADMLSRDYSRRQRQRALLLLSAPQIDSYGIQPQYMQNTFFLNRGDNTFAEIAPFAGLTASEWTWGAIFLDADLDGYPDLLISCGNLQDLMDADTQLKNAATVSSLKDMANFRRQLPLLNARCQLFHNRGNLRFEEVGERFGFHAERAHGGMVVCDLDNDGDLDVVINNADGQPEIYRNDCTAPRIAVKLHGRPPNTSGIGAQVQLIGQIKTQTQEVIAGGRYASGCDYTLSFAARQDWAPYALRVTWRNGRVSDVPGVQANRLYVITETNSAAAPPRLVPKADPLFEDVSAMLNHTNYENAFDDFEAQPLLPNRMSRLGPGVSWFDIDGDGLDDLIIGTARDGAMGIFRNLGQGRFSSLTAADKQIHPRHDQTTVLAWGTRQDGVILMMGISCWEDPHADVGVQLIKLGQSGEVEMGPHMTRGKNVTGPLAMADVTGDGNMAVFVGGRVHLGRYPEPADSTLILRDSQGRLTEAGAAAAGALMGLGLVTSAVFADLNGDGRPDLIVGCEWGPIQILINTGRGFTNATAAWGLDKLTGWWNGDAVGDFDGDGRIDIVASNWGQNSKYEDSYGPDRPLRIYYCDFNEIGRVEIVEAHQDRHMGKWVPERDLTASANAVPYIRGRTPTFQQFGEADLPQIYGDKLTNAAVVEACELRHMLFLNRGGKFEAVPLPVEAQFAPAFGVVVADFDGDGNDDVFLAQNFFSSQPETMRNDAGRGLLLLGDGKGGLRPVSAQESGIAIYGEQRGCAVSDYDGDGRVDLVVVQSNDATKLLHNRRARPGLRVRLEGGPDNPQCIGAVIRAVTSAGVGRAQVVTAGSGYWSQNSATLVVTSASSITALNVRWPDGTVEERPVPPGPLTLTLRQPNARLASPQSEHHP
jgi:hypothetical protein